MNPRYAILIDGGFFVRKVYSKLSRMPLVDDVEREIVAIQKHDAFKNFDLLRVYYYDATPATGKLTNPISKEAIDLGQTEVFKRNKSFLDSLELKSNVALRLGELSANGWKLKKKSLKNNDLSIKPLVADDLVMDIEQKGVDLRIGLDIARLSMGGLVSSIVVVTGDSDFVPAFKFARREGVRVILSHMGHGVKRELKAHTDIVLEDLPT